MSQKLKQALNHVSHPSFDQKLIKNRKERLILSKSVNSVGWQKEESRFRDLQNLDKKEPKNLN